MRSFARLKAVAAALPLDNVDTDKILPAEHLKTVSRAGLGRALFARMRYHDDGSEQPGFVLNRGPWRHAQILVAGANFGCGSSREHAPWALVDFGISCVIASSFADIFYNNCFKNGILPIVLANTELAELQAAASREESATFEVDLHEQRILKWDGAVVRFEIDGGRKAALVEGRDEIAETLSFAAELSAWDERLHATIPDARMALAALDYLPSSRMSGT